MSSRFVFSVFLVVCAMTIFGWSQTNCTWMLETYCPLILDTANTGFSFSDPNGGEYVSFDMIGNGKLEKFSWPRAGSGNAWLVYDQDGDGVIEDGTELFGNFSPYSDHGVPNHPNPNGFLALAWYDQTEKGGNADLIIDKRDAVWNKLRLWVDQHCYKTPDEPCRSLPSELHTLESKGVISLSLVYSADGRKDSIGNEFKYYAVVNPDAHETPKDEHGHVCCDLHQKSKDPRQMYDVFLKEKTE